MLRLQDFNAINAGDVVLAGLFIVAEARRIRTTAKIFKTENAATKKLNFFMFRYEYSVLKISRQQIERGYICKKRFYPSSVRIKDSVDQKNLT